MLTMRITAIITGGGRGTRFGGDLPKQFHSIPRRNSKFPIIIWTARQFERCDVISDIILSVPLEYMPHTKRLVKKFKLKKVTSIVAGGETRRDSVRNALWSIAQNPPDAVLIHDAVRPFVDEALINRVIDELKRFPIIVPVITPNDTIRRKGKRHTLGRLEDRDTLLMIQTPQAFRWKVVTQLLPKWNLNKTATDDASIAIEHGVKVGYVEGSPHNFKITSRDDLHLARALARTWVDTRSES